MIKINKVRTYSIKSRFSKVEKRDFASLPGKGAKFLSFYDSLPNILKAKDLRAVVESILLARRKKKQVILMSGAHTIKCGLNPVLIELLKKKAITALCLNGACMIHDFELAFQGRTSEDVAASLKNGRFGMGRETAEFINNAVNDGVSEGLGLGNALAREIALSKLRYRDLSLFANAYKYNVPVYVFVAVGTDIIHQHPSFDASLTAEGSQRDFHSLVETIKGINKGGVVLNVGSAVILPEVFLKALNLSRNLSGEIKDFTTANFDMIQQYRPVQNVVTRPVITGGKGYYIIGHHEIMLPFLAQAIIEKL